MVYLDNNATTRPSAAVAAAVAEALADCWHNPSSVHRPGQAARHRVELARRDIAALIGARPKDVVFTSGGTESIDLAIRGVIDAASPSAGTPVIVSTPVEHAAVRDLLDDLAKRGRAEVRWAPIGRDGIVDSARLAPLLAGAAVASIQWANNETGAIQPVAGIAALCRATGVPFHCDATQWVGKMPVDAGEGPGYHGAPDRGASPPFPDLLTFAPHKFHGPKGVGVLWRRHGVGLRPTIHGAQELGRRGGTENVPGILGAAVAAREAAQWLADPARRRRLGALRDRFEAAVLGAVPGALVNGPRDDRRLWNTTNIAFPRLEAEAMLLLLSESGLCASAGAACSSGSLDPSPVLLAMGVPPEVAHGSLRFSLSRETTDAEIDRAVELVAAAALRLGAGGVPAGSHRGGGPGSLSA